MSESDVTLGSSCRRALRSSRSRVGASCLSDDSEGARSLVAGSLLRERRLYECWGRVRDVDAVENAGAGRGGEFEFGDDGCDGESVRGVKGEESEDEVGEMSQD